MKMLNIDRERAKAAAKHGYDGLFGTPDNVYEFIKMMFSRMPDKSGTMTLAQGILNHMALRCLALEEDAVKKLENFPGIEDKKIYFTGFLTEKAGFEKTMMKLVHDTKGIEEDDLVDYWNCVKIDGKIFDYNYCSERGTLTLYWVEGPDGGMATDEDEERNSMQTSLFRTWKIGKSKSWAAVGDLE